MSDVCARTRSASAWPGLCMAAVLLWAGCADRSASRREPPSVAENKQMPHAGGTPSSACGQCHKAIYEECRQSPHANAFMNPEYVAATRQHRERECLRCHVPMSLDRLDQAPVRDKFHEEGVNCESCHLRDGTYVAPKLFTAHAPHRMAEDPVLYKSHFCGRCHRAALDQWSAAAVDPILLQIMRLPLAEGTGNGRGS